MPVENPAAVNSSVRPRSRKRACYGLSRLRTGEAAEAPHRRVVAAFRTEQAAYELVKAIRDPLDVTPIREMEKGGRTSAPALLLLSALRPAPSLCRFHVTAGRVRLSLAYQRPPPPPPPPL